MKTENIPTLITARQIYKTQAVWRALKHILKRNGGTPDRPWAFVQGKYWVTWLPTGEVITTKEHENG